MSIGKEKVIVENNIQGRPYGDLLLKNIWYSYLRTKKTQTNGGNDYEKRIDRACIYFGPERLYERQKEKYGWEFLFLGANIDAIAEAGKEEIEADYRKREK